MKKIFGIEEFLKKIRLKVDKKIEKYLPRKASKEWLRKFFGNRKYSLFTIQKAILDPIWDFLDRGGKRWRPALFFLILEAFRKNPEKFEDLGIIPELAHEGSIIADDIEDQGELRRGKPCLHKIFGIDVALNCGSFLYFLPILIFKENKKKLKEKIYLKLIETYLEELANLHLGQAIDIFWHKQKEIKISEKEWLSMVALKTGSMARLSAKMAAILAEKEELLPEVEDFAEKIGIAFQIQDDILDISLSDKKRKKFGKIFGNDIKEGKKTLLVIYAAQKANQKEKRDLFSALGKKQISEKEIKKVISIMEKYNAIEKAREKAKEILEEIVIKVEKIFPKSQAKEKIKKLCKFLIEREI